MDEPRVDIVVNNYNYERFVGEAIDSALSQNHPSVAVVVVDDGSTDDSRDVISAYGERVTPVLKSNGGQGSAYNAGFEECSGDIVIFLDADDVLVPGIIERVVRAHAAQPSAAKISYRLEMVDSHLDSLGALFPEEGKEISTAQVSDIEGMLVSPVSPPASGNAYPMWVLERIMPIGQEAAFRNAADRYLIELAPLFGPTAVVDTVGALYRVHDTNHGLRHSGRVNMSRVRGSLERTAALAEIKSRHAAHDSGEALAFWGLSHISFRALSRKVDRDTHPFTDSLIGLCASGLRGAVRRPGLPLHKRLSYVAWFLAVLALPRRAVLALAALRMRAVSIVEHPSSGAPIP